MPLMITLVSGDNECLQTRKDPENRRKRDHIVEGRELDMLNAGHFLEKLQNSIAKFLGCAVQKDFYMIETRTFGGNSPKVE